MSDTFTIVDKVWFTGQRGAIGVVRVVTAPAGEVKYYISPVDGFNEAVDANCVAAFGARFPNDAGDVLFGITR